MPKKAAKKTTGKKASRKAAKKAPARKVAPKKKAASKRAVARKSAKKAGRKSAKKAASKQAVQSSRPSQKGAANKRKPARERAKTSRARTAAYEAERDYEEEDEGGWLPDSNFFKFVIAILLLPVCYATSEAFFELVTAAAVEGGLWQNIEVWSFVAGAAIWLVWFLWLPRPLYLYVFGHEATHAVVAFFCGADVPKFKASSQGGYIYTTKSNFLISLAPYLIPFYTVILLAVSVFLTLFIDVYAYQDGAVFGQFGISWIWVLMGLVGFTWCFHLTFTVWMIGKDQPDLTENGVFFSLVLIYLANLAIICSFLLVGSPEIGFGHFRTNWLESLQSLAGYAKQLVEGIGWLLQKALGTWR